MGHHQREVWFKDAHENPRHADLYDERDKEESRSVLESKNINSNLCEEDDGEHEDSAQGVEGEGVPHALPRSVMVGKDGLHHSEKRDAH